ncbi:MAG: aminotransferase class IV, partial [Ignavibacteriaceae bacterium]|nr:aminotransferase class IV [Ignavibacteriaceae bacterium]
LNRGFLFADGVYELLRTYNKKLFRYDDHFDRLKFSLEELNLKVPDKKKLTNIIAELVSLNQLEENNFSVYIQITRGSDFKRQHKFPALNIDQTLMIWLTPISPDRLENENGIKAITHEDLRWQRCDIKSILLLPNILAKQKAIEQDATEALLIRDGYVMEGSHTNLFIIPDGVIKTPPLSNYVLKGITRKVILELCTGSGMIVKEEKISLDELLSANEIFLTGTSTEVKPVIELSGQKIGSGMPGKVTRKVQQLFYNYINEY